MFAIKSPFFPGPDRLNSTRFVKGASAANFQETSEEVRCAVYFRLRMIGVRETLASQSPSLSARQDTVRQPIVSVL